jgi:hypothetical protein
MLKFEQDGTLPGGEMSYRLVIDGETIAEGLSLDQVIEAINRRDEEKLGEDHAPRTCPSQSPPRAAATALPEGASQGREPPAGRRRKAALGPFRRR